MGAGRHHADLLDPAFWQAQQRRIRDGQLIDVFPYDPARRFARRNAAPAPADAAPNLMEMS